MRHLLHISAKRAKAGIDRKIGCVLLKKIVQLLYVVPIVHFELRKQWKSFSYTY